MTGENCNVLIVDDSALIRQVVKRTLSMANVPVSQWFEAADGQAALDVLRTNKVDLVLADLHMPTMSGVEMAQRIMADPAMRQIPVIVISADPNTERLDGLKRQGVRACIRKPFTPEDLRNVVREVLGGPDHE